MNLYSNVMLVEFLLEVVSDCLSEGNGGSIKIFSVRPSSSRRFVAGPQSHGKQTRQLNGGGGKSRR